MTARGTLIWAALLGAIALTLGALAVEAGASAFGVPRALLAWSAVSLLVTVGLYVYSAFHGSSGPWMAGHRGRLLQPLVWPFRAVATVLWWLMRGVRNDGPGVPVVPGIWVGPKPFASEAETIRKMGITALLDLTAELPESPVFDRDPFVRLRIPTLDRTQPTDDDLDRAVAWVLARRAEGRGVLVHCAFGRGRSAMVVVALMLALGESAKVDEAIQFVTRARPSTRLRSAQRDSLQRFLGRRSGRS